MKKLLLSTALLMAAGPVLADTAATVAADLNLRDGPGAQYPSIAVMPAGTEVPVTGCVEARDWCKVTFEDTEGWAYGPYLAVPVGEEIAAIAAAPETVEIATVTFVPAEEKAEQNASAATGATVGALTAFALGGPAGAIVAGGILGGAAGSAAATPEEATLVYIRENPVEPVYLQGEVVVGATVPDVVTFHTIPDANGLRYLNINGEPVVVDETGQITYILR